MGISIACLKDGDGRSNLYIRRRTRNNMSSKAKPTLIISNTDVSYMKEYSQLSLSRSRRDLLKHFEISVLRHIRCAELRIEENTNRTTKFHK